MTTESTFPEASEAQWRALAEKSLKGAAFDEALVSHTDDAIRLEPLHLRSRNPMPLARARNGGSWNVLQRVDDPDPVRANAQARDDVAGGADGLALVFSGAPNAFGYGLPGSPEALATVLDGIPVNRIALRIDTHPMSRLSAEWLVAYLGKRRADPGRLTLSFGIDPAALFVGTGRLRMSIEALEASMPQSLAHFFALGAPGVLLEADGRVCHNAGATEGQELGFMLASAVAHMRMFEMARQPLVYAAPHVGFSASADQDQLVTIAKLRALRRLWTRAQELCGIAPSQAAVHVETSWRMLTRNDPETNILRSTIAVFAAAVAGADSISVLPHTYAHGLPAAFARRVARNTQIVLAQESNVGFVNDPAAGSGSIAHLTDALCEAGWREFQQIETEGGLLKSLAAGQFQARVEAARAARAASYRTGARAIVGTTLYPLARERPVETLAADRRAPVAQGTLTCRPLLPQRIDETLGDAA